MNEREERVLIEANITEDAVKYYTLSTLFILVVCIVTIPLIPIIVPLVYILKKIEFKRIRCTLTTRSVKINRGVFTRIEKSIPLDKITDAALTQGPIMRRFNIESIQFETAGQASVGAAASIVGIENGRAFRDAVLKQRDIITDNHGTGSGEGAPAPATSEGPILGEIRDALLRIEKKLDRDES